MKSETESKLGLKLLLKKANLLTSLRDRLMVGHMPLAHSI